MSITVAPTATISVQLPPPNASGRPYGVFLGPSACAAVDLVVDAAPGRVSIVLPLQTGCTMKLDFTANQLFALMNELAEASELLAP